MSSLLQSEGHPEARLYPVPLLWQELQIVRRRLNRVHATEATLTRMAVSSVLSKEAGKQFDKTVKKLSED
jgi:hypothetical protein